MSALGDEIAAIIAAEGPITVARYMELALGHPKHGYYVTRDPLGRAGDFITAPEISQMFGELIGLWLAQSWLDQGAPDRFTLAEAGPGRGTLMADLLRATRGVPGFHDAARVHLVETSPVLRAVQAGALAEVAPGATWHDDIAGLPADQPLWLVANEFLDALPVRQFVRIDDGWRERLVGVKDGALGFGLAPEPTPLPIPTAAEGSVFETSPAALAAMAGIGARVSRQGGAALLIDYGHVVSGCGDTFQAIHGHVFADPLADPGEADLTAHVDFAAMAAAARLAGAEVQGPVTQAAFLRSLGLEARAERLMAGKSADRAGRIAGERDRLVDMAPTGMGQLFKVLALTAPGVPKPPGFG
jgi:NADH dehydrogenase [ubiquinone] 1 alpha subcomplex assembly factor 7